MLAQSGLSLKDQLPGSDVTIAEALMAPTVIYVKQVIDILYDILKNTSFLIFNSFP